MNFQLLSNSTGVFLLNGGFVVGFDIEVSRGESPARNWSHINLPNSPGPLDEFALELGIHLPLPIHPHREMAFDCEQNGHHGVFPSKHPWLYDNMGKPPLHPIKRVYRWSQVQETSIWSHQDYHDEYDGVVLPTTELEWFQATLLREIGYLPPMAVDLSHAPPPKLTKLGFAERSYLNSPGVLHAQRGTRAKIGQYFAQQIIKHGIGYVAETKTAIDFLQASDPKIKYKLGHTLFRLAAAPVVEPAEKLFQHALKNGRVGGEPRGTVRFLMLHLDNHQEDYFQTIEERLRAA